MEKPNTSWIAEFGTEFSVPDEILALVASGQATDASWHNDTCPGFHHSTTDRRILVDHPDAAQREMNGAKRFTVIYFDADAQMVTLYHGDNLQEALSIFERKAFQPKAFIDAIEGFYSAAANLCNVWQDSDVEVDEDHASEAYPFKESFDETLCLIALWMQRQKATK